MLSAAIVVDRPEDFVQHGHLGLIRSDSGKTTPGGVTNSLDFPKSTREMRSSEGSIEITLGQGRCYDGLDLTSGVPALKHL
jgi:hypothetical protein